MYFLLFHRFVFLISVLGCHYSYTETLIFYILMLHAVYLTLLFILMFMWVCIILRIFYMEYFVVWVCGYFDFFFHTLVIFVFLLNCRGRLSSTMLNKRGENGHPCPFPDVGGKAFNLSPSSMRLAEGLSYMHFMMLKYVPNLRPFYH